MLVDDFSAALPPQPAVLAGNFWPNATFETGTNLNRTNGVPSNWAASGDDPTICQVTTNNYTSATHALVIVDSNTNGYGEWDADLLLSTNAAPDDLLDIQYSELYSVTNGEMRVTALFYDSVSNVLGKADFTVRPKCRVAGIAGRLVLRAPKTPSARPSQRGPPAYFPRLRRPRFHHRNYGHR